MTEPAPLHMLKLCVGAESFDDQKSWIETMVAQKQRLGIKPEQMHTTRMVPKQREALLSGGSLYWVIKGTIQARQKLLDIRPFQDSDGIGRCHLVLETKLIPTRPVPRRPFQGWRYLKAGDEPPDLSGSDAAQVGHMSLEMRQELASLGLL